MVAWLVATVLLFVLVRAPFALVPVIPYQVEFQPGVVLAPLAGVFWGPAGAVGMAAASLIGDALYGMWGVLSPFRAIGLFLFAYSSKALWDYTRARTGKPGSLDPTWGSTVRFLYVTTPGCILAALWPALAADFYRLYAFPYILFLLLANNVLFTALLGPALYRILARELVPHFGCWREVMAEHSIRILSVRGARLHVAGCLGAAVIGSLVAGGVYKFWPARAVILGDTCGPLLWMAVVPFMALQVMGFFFTEERVEKGLEIRP